MIKFNSNNINKWLKGTSQVNKVYKGEVSCYPDITSDTPPTPPTPHDYSLDYLTFTATENGTFTFIPSCANTISYSTDNGSTWTEGNSVSVSANDKVLWKGTMTPYNEQGNYGVGYFSSTNAFTVEGNAHSLLWGDNFVGETSLSGKVSALNSLFYNCSHLTSAENLVLPATTLEGTCYCGMFSDCTNLTTAPTLSATTLASYCYGLMFYNCRSLTTAPQLPATTLASMSYYNMFYGCSSLNSITCLAIDISAFWSTNDWVRNVAASGTFTKAASMNDWTSGEHGIPSNWTIQNYQG